MRTGEHHRRRERVVIDRMILLRANHASFGIARAAAQRGTPVLFLFPIENKFYLRGL
jgi:hypothetical protein